MVPDSVCNRSIKPTEFQVAMLAARISASVGFQHTKYFLQDSVGRKHWVLRHTTSAFKFRRIALLEIHKE